MPGTLGVAAAVALLVAVGTTPLAQHLARRWGFVDRPASHKAHGRPTPMLGGLAVVCAVLVATLASNDATPDGRWRWIVVSGVVLAALGGWDDRRPLPVTLRLVVQTLVMATTVAQGFLLIDGPSWWAASVTVGWLLLVTNALNLLDNVDGVAGAVGAVAAMTFALLGGNVLAAALAGACSGFLVFNRPPARIFLGDAGSLPLGYWLAVLGVEVARPGTTAWALVVPVLVLVVPLFDTTLVSVSRLRRGHNPLTTPGLDHVAHRLRRLGLGPWAVIGVLVGIGMAGAAGAWWLHHTKIDLPILGAIALLAMVMAVVAGVAFERPRLLGQSAAKSAR